MENHFLWIDCEMTGLDANTDHILEIALILTNTNLQIIHEQEWVLSCDEHILESMNDWCKEHHARSNLLQKVKESKLIYSNVERDILNILTKNTHKKQVYFAGNSVYNDVFFMKKYMSFVVDWCHYRLFDVSTLKIMREQFYSHVPAFQKEKNHTALRDIQESISEFEYYRSLFFK